jgi:hypothetical protein
MPHRFDLADVHVMEFNATEGEANAQLQWVPELAISTWADQTPHYIYNPAPVTTTDGSITVTTQMHLSGRSHATAFAEVGSMFE